MSSTTGIVAVVAWKAHPSNLLLVKEWLALGIRAELLNPPEAHHELWVRSVSCCPTTPSRNRLRWSSRETKRKGERQRTWSRR